jgi:ketosteroid isomerase-like protein
MPRAKSQTAALMASPDDVEAQFYEALQLGDLERMMAVWADEDEVACVHPGGARLIGPEAVRGAFESLFAQGGVEAAVHQVRRMMLGTCAVHHVLERVRISAEDGAPYGFVVATNVYTHTPMGWRMLVHHASPGHAREIQDIIEVPTGVLH